MFKKVICLLALCLFSGCVSPLKVTIFEVLQVPATTRIYTSSNLWYVDPVEMNSFNYQAGELLPYGTEVVDVDIDFDDEYVMFKAKGTGSVFRIKLMKNYAMMTMNEFLKSNFMATNPAEVELSINPTIYEKVVRGVVEKGMTKNEVRMCYGLPPRHRTSSLKENTWIYHKSRTESKRVVFKNGKVSHIINY